MPNYKGHLAGGLVISLIFMYVVSWWFPITIVIALQLLICALFGSLFPDIDTKSQGQLLSYRLLAAVIIMLVLQQRIILALACSSVALLPLVVHHRGLFHRAWFIGALSACIVLYTWSTMPQYGSAVALHTFFFMIGAFSHIWLDVGIKRMWRV